MDEEIERLIVRVRADTGAFASDVAAMQASLEGPLSTGVDRAGRAIETTLARAIRTGKLGFDDLRDVALKVLGEIAAAAVLGNAPAGGGGGGLVGLLGQLIGGAPGRATGGPVSPQRPYWVGERGPELFVPTSSGRVLPAEAGAARDVRVAITINTNGNGTPGQEAQALRQSGRQVARAVRAALMEA